MAGGQMQIRTQKFMYNKLLNRKQFVIEVTMPANKGTIPTKDIRAKLQQMYKVADENTISIFGFKYHFGGGKATGFGLIYDRVKDLQKFEPEYRQIRMGLKEAAAITTSRKQRKERKNRAKKARGLKKAKILGKK